MLEKLPKFVGFQTTTKDLHLIEKLDKEAKEKKISRSELIRRILWAHIGIYSDR